MPVPPPRIAPHQHDDRELARERFLATWATVYDQLREGGRAQLQHAALMAERSLGGTVYIYLPSRIAKRDLPEAGYVSEVPPGAPIGKAVPA